MRRENEIYFNKDKNHEDYICSPQSQDTAFKTIPFSITRIGQFYFKQVSYLQKSWFHPFVSKYVSHFFTVAWEAWNNPVLTENEQKSKFISFALHENSFPYL